MPGNRGVYPGTFDPVTKGHMDIIVRGARVVDELIVAVAVNAGKGPLFTLDERVEMLKEDIAALPGDLAPQSSGNLRNALVNFDELRDAFATTERAMDYI